MNFYDRISNENLNINNTEKRIIEYILEKSQNFSHIKITDIANDLFLSCNTIIRLCKKLGYSGFSELKYDINNGNKSIIVDNDCPISMQNTIIQTLSLNKKESYFECAAMMQVANNIVIFSLGLSQYPALSFAKRLQHFDKICIIPEDRDSCMLFAKNLKQNDLAIIVSSSGETDIMRKISTTIRSKNIPTISLTGFSQNIVSQLSDISLYTYLKHFNIDSHDLTSRVGFDIVLDLLFEEYCNLYVKNNFLK